MLYLVTYGDDPTKIKYIKSDYINVGLGKKFKDLFSKFEELKYWIEKVPKPNDIVVFVDGYDVIQKRTDLDNFEKEFEAMDADLVLSAETYCWPNNWMKHLFPITETKYRFPNSGTFAGRACAVQKMLEWAPYRINYDDQGYVHDFFLRCKTMKIVLDEHQKLFQTAVGVEWYDIDATQAYFIHFNGKSHMTIDGGSILDECASGRPIGGFTRYPQDV